MAEPIYLNYGTNQIDQAQFLTNAADNVSNWVSQQSWSKKRKEKFLNAYSDIMSRGVKGASNTSGQWAVDLDSEIDLESMSKKDQEMYHEAAYYILQQMKGITPKAAEEEKKKEDLPLYDNKYFTEQFQGYIGNQLFGGQNYTTDQWNDFDAPDSTTGIRGTSNRAAKLAQMLEEYGNTLQEGKYNFENTPHADLNDLKSKISNAVQALRDGTWDQNDVDALNRLGINPNTYFQTGANEQVTLQDGTTMTRQQYVDALAQQQAEKEQAEQAAVKQKEAEQIKADTGVLSVLNGIYGHEAKTDSNTYTTWLAEQVGTGQEGYNNTNNLIQGLLEKGYTSGLTQAEKKQLGNLLYHVRNNNPAYQGIGYGQKSGITQEEFDELKIHKNINSQNINDYIRLPWQTSDGRNIYADNKGAVYYLKPRGHKKLASLKLDRSKINEDKNNYLLSTTKEGQRQLASQRGLFEGGFTEKASDTARAIALGEDILSAVAAFVPTYGTALSGGLSLDSLRNDLIADALDKSVSTGQMLKNVGWNAALGLVGLIPGGKFLKTGTWAKSVARLAPHVLSGGLIASSVMKDHPQVLASWQKALDGKDLDLNDWKNIGESLRWVSGTARTGKYTHNTVKYGRTNPKTTSGKEIQTTKNGKSTTAKLTNEQYEKINKAKTEDAANKVLEEAGYKDHKVASFEAGKLRNVPIPGMGRVRRRVEGENYTEAAALTSRQKGLQQKYAAQDARNRLRLNSMLNPLIQKLPTKIGNRLTDIGSKIPTDYQVFGTTAIPQSVQSTVQPKPTTTQPKPQTSQLPPKTEHISPKDFNLPNLNLDAYVKNRTGEGKMNYNRSSKPLDSSKDHVGTIKFGSGGDQLNFKISNGELVVTNAANKVITQKKLNSTNYTQDAKLTLGKTISDYRKQLISNKQIRKAYTKEFIQSLKDLKKQGYLYKHGGTLDTTIANFLKTQI